MMASERLSLLVPLPWEALRLGVLGGTWPAPLLGKAARAARLKLESERLD